MKTLAERIKDLPEGTKLYSPCYGEMEFVGTTDASIICRDAAGIKQHLLANGSVHNYGECMLFPSKEGRDWEKYLAARNKFDVRTLQPFDKVLVRDNDREAWEADFFSYYYGGEDSFRCVSVYWKQCVPYNDDTKHLLGYNKQAPEYYITWKE